MELILQSDPVQALSPCLRIVVFGGTWQTPPTLGRTAILSDGTTGKIIYRTRDLAGLEGSDGLRRVDQGEIVDEKPSELEIGIRELGWIPVPLPEDVFKHLYDEEGWDE